MPLYDFRCKDCQEVFEVRLSLTEKEKGVKKPCPKCGSNKVQQFFGAMGYVRKCVPSPHTGFT
mgnify:CR=1 FL=1